MTNHKTPKTGNRRGPSDFRRGYKLAAILAFALYGPPSIALADNASREVNLLNSPITSSSDNRPNTPQPSSSGYDRVLAYVVAPDAERQVAKIKAALDELEHHIGPSNIDGGAIPKRLSRVDYSELEVAYAEAVKHRKTVLARFAQQHEERLKELDGEIEAHTLDRAEARQVVQNVSEFVSDEQRAVDQKTDEIEQILADMNHRQTALREELNEVIVSEELPVRTLERLQPLQFRSQVRDRVSDCSFSGPQDLIVKPDASHVTCLQVRSPTFRGVEEGRELLHEVIRSHAFGIFNLQYKVAGLNYQPHYPNRFGPGSLREELHHLKQELDNRIVIAENRYGSLREAKRLIKRSEARLSELERVKESVLSGHSPKDRYLIAYGVKSDTSSLTSVWNSTRRTGDEIDLSAEEQLETVFNSLKGQALDQVFTETASDPVLVSGSRFQVSPNIGNLVIVGVQEDARTVRGRSRHRAELFTKPMGDRMGADAVVSVDLGKPPKSRWLFGDDGLQNEEGFLRYVVSGWIFRGILQPD